MKLRSMLFGAPLLALCACQRDPGPPARAQTASPAPAATAAPTAAATPAANAAPAGGGISGKVVETMNAAGYTYARLDSGGTEVWVAGPETPLTVGMQVSGLDGMLMTGFTSETLKRTFDKIYFVTSYGPAGGGAPPAAGAGATQATVAAAHSGVGGTASDAPVEKVEPAKGGKTVEQVFASKAELSGKPVIVRGKIVKVNRGILGRNWLHVRDGSGSAGTNDLLVTTSAEPPELGAVVVVRGTVATDRDFGSGYSYSVLVENAALSAE